MLPLLAEDNNAVVSLKPAGLRVSEQEVVSGHGGDGGVGEEERRLPLEGDLAADGPDDGVTEQSVHLGLEGGLGTEVGVSGGASPLCGDEEMLAGAGVGAQRPTPLTAGLPAGLGHLPPKVATEHLLEACLALPLPLSFPAVSVSLGDHDH